MFWDMFLAPGAYYLDVLPPCDEYEGEAKGDEDQEDCAHHLGGAQRVAADVLVSHCQNDGIYMGFFHWMGP